MRLRPPGINRKHLASSARVALVATLVVIVVYAAAVALLDLFVAHRLVGQVDRQLSARLDAARSLPPPKATEEPDTSGSTNYGLGIYGEPIYVWEVRAGSRQPVTSAGTPRLQPGSWPSLRQGALTRAVDGTDYRLMTTAYRGGYLVAGESLVELAHVESVLVNSELVAGPVLAVAVFLASLLIGLRSAAPIETARRRQLEFTADASHELRTPLSVIEAELSLVRSPDDPTGFSAAHAAEALDRIAWESERLRRIVDDLLWLARFDSTPPPPGAESIDLTTIAELCAARFQPVAGARGIELAVVRLGDDPAMVDCPAEWMDRLAGVLVDNACKYAGRYGTVHVEVGRVGGQVVLAVEDSGPGIPDAERERLFDRFRRGTDRAGGHGLGLAIADSIVCSTGGRWKIGEAKAGGARIEVSWTR